MWVMTTAGMVVATQSPEDPERLRVLAHDRSSLQSLSDTAEMVAGIEPAEIFRTFDAPMPYRVDISREAFSAWLSFEAEQYVCYTDFFDAVGSASGRQWRDVALAVWDAARGIPDRG